ncbi:hypothetical protein RclHR1_03140003 [Rhizophagus clarus]|uniref:BTB/POZ domain-containing protein n=1 Tax=Rhizophagus clarus TaxID=94130 RepID=A0A2Z6RJ49_9GLOM|nr:hypothetical protein RclHR1_03140003 [Rhizophagus clarus]GES99225.1 BTB/POZ domain-containing protein [Rhizophagus clarus]
MSCNFESEVSKAFEKLLKNETDYNVIICIGEEPNVKEFHAHHIMLRCRSEYFNKIFSDENIEKKDGNYIIKNSNIVPQAFESILKYLYTGHINIININEPDLLNILIASDELKLKRLTKFTEDFIIEKHHQFLRNDPVGILQAVYYRKLLVKLQEFCLRSICSEPKILFNSEKFINLPASLLEIILKRNDLNLTEIEIWDYLIKWGSSQETVLKQDVSEWNQEDINIFKGILQNFIPLIRFYEISSEDYYNKVKPYEGILSKELKDDILKFYMVPGYKQEFNINGSRCSNNGKYRIKSSVIKNISSFFSKINYYQDIIKDDETKQTSPPELPSPHLVLYIFLWISLSLTYFDGIILSETLESIFLCFFIHYLIIK